MNTISGEVRWFNLAKGYGLIRPDSVDVEEIRFDHSSLANKGAIPIRGDRVEVFFKEDLVGLVAEKVTIVESVIAKQKRLEKLLTLAEKMPKVELHVHLEGAVSPDTLFKIAHKNNYDLQVQSPEELARSFKFRDFFHFIGLYSQCANALQTSDDYAQVTYEYLRIASQQNVQYVEAYFSPYDRMRRGLSFEEIVDGVSNGKAKALTEFGIGANFVVDVGRHLLWTEARNLQNAHDECLRLVELASKAKEQGIVGFSLGGREVSYPVTPFAEAFELARQRGLHTKAHSGEAAEPEDIWDVIQTLKVERIGNPVRAWEDRSLVDYIAQTKMPLEICITGNVLTGATQSISSHPLRHYWDQGIPITLGSDDPTLFNTTLTREYQLAVEHFCFSAQDLCNLGLESIEMSWLPGKEKNALRTVFESKFDALRQELGV